MSKPVNSLGACDHDVVIALEALLLAMFVQTLIWALQALLRISLVLAG